MQFSTCDFPTEILLKISDLLAPLDLLNLVLASFANFGKVCCVYYDTHASNYRGIGDRRLEEVHVSADNCEIRPDYLLHIFIVANSGVLSQCLSKSKSLKRVVVIDGLINENPPADDIGITNKNTLVLIMNLKNFSVTSNDALPSTFVAENIGVLEFNQQLVKKSSQTYHFKSINTLELNIRAMENLENLDCFRFPEDSNITNVKYFLDNFKPKYWDREDITSYQDEITIPPFTLRNQTLFISSLELLLKFPVSIEQITFPHLTHLRLYLFSNLEEFPIIDKVSLLKLKDLSISFFGFAFEDFGFPTIIKDIKIGQSLKHLTINIDMPKQDVILPFSAIKYFKLDGPLSLTKFEYLEELSYAHRALCNGVVVSTIASAIPVESIYRKN